MTISPHSTGTARQRRYSMPETYRAIAHAMSRPGTSLVAPDVHPLPVTLSRSTPTAELLLPEGQLTALIGWAAVMDVQSVVVLPLIQPAGLVRIRVTGVLFGPTVVAMVCLDDDDLPVEIAGRTVHAVGREQMLSLIGRSAAIGADTLVGV